ncbi:MAG: helix-turn-helix domain-containing protein [Acidobacteriia bacterium]|nr:helix-turn-helix domain-containing protein [Terriglobia bacterium]
MERPGAKLKRTRERLKLTYRDVEDASQQVARRRGSDEFAIALSRLADIENKGTVPTIFRLYTLAAIYRLEWRELLGWYGVPVELLPSECLQIGLEETHEIRLAPDRPVSIPQPLDCEIDPHKTTFLSTLIGRWGKMPLSLLNGLDVRHHRYGLIGLEDWSMYPVLRPGSLVLIDQSRRKIAAGGWTNEYDRPVYFLEHRGGYLCGWCAVADGRLLLQPHPASQQRPAIFTLEEIDVIGQVTGAAMLWGSQKQPHARG